MRELLFVAGEVSGDLHAARVARELAARGAPFRLTGIGGDEMRTAGVELIEHVGNLAVMGFVEVVGTLRRHWGLLRELKRRFRTGDVAAVVLVDYPDFNMLVASAAARVGVPVLYYITPQVWAWRAGRLDKLARTVTRAAVILPFEEPLLREHGISVTFVGHPLLDRVATLPDRAAARAALGLAPADRVLGLFPGSRRQEIEHNLDGFVAAARELQRRDPQLRVMVAAAPHVTIDPARCPFPIAAAGSFTVLRAADAALCKSGTTTLEAAVAGCPFVIAYRLNQLNYEIARRVVKIPNIGLVNVVAGYQLVPEFVQDALEPGALADALEPLLDAASADRAAMLDGLERVRASLGTPGAAARVASIAVELAAASASAHAG
ncbi:MAG TPA: lipid-A-disaccharide synthase [Gemmatimonadaceae bacterium]|nr:lipid-A-disaccharide synthase [Gemmatimonadaceae bacterium]